jgi:hypothetical protein
MPVVTELIFLGVLKVFFVEQSSLHIMELYTLNVFFFVCYSSIQLPFVFSERYMRTELRESRTLITSL